jgi:uncharacterized protein (TIGR00725 family)
MSLPRYVSVIGAGEATEHQSAHAYAVGNTVARAGHILVCGGMGGVMEAAAKGAAAAGGVSIGILPTDDRSTANPYLTVSIPTGFSHGRNYLVVKSGEGVIAIGGGAGTMSEIGLALKLGRPVVLLDSLDIEAAGIMDPGFQRAGSATEALDILTHCWA